jgi:sugar lactone lactonase YvrE
MKRRSRTLRPLRTLCLVALSLGAAAQAPAGEVLQTLATGLNNPRGLAFAPTGALYVAEMGNGGPGPCIPSPAAPVPRCYGETGALSRIEPHRLNGFKRVIKGLPSLGLPNGQGEAGPADIAFNGLVAFVTVGMGGDPALRSTFGERGKIFGSLLAVLPWGGYLPIVDIMDHEVRYNPYGGAIDSNPYGLLAQPGRYIIADAGANALIEHSYWRRGTRTFATLPPASGGRDPVPTAVAEGPDGALYVSQLTGFPFFRGSSSVLRISSDGSEISTYAEGFTAAVDIEVDRRGALYVLETAAGQVPPFPPPAPGLGVGRLVRQCPGAQREILLENLSFPGGMTLGWDGAVYLTNKGTSATQGEVLRLEVKACKKKRRS